MIHAFGLIDLPTGTEVLLDYKDDLDSGSMLWKVSIDSAY